MRKLHPFARWLQYAWNTGRMCQHESQPQTLSHPNHPCHRDAQLHFLVAPQIKHEILPRSGMFPDMGLAYSGKPTLIRTLKGNIINYRNLVLKCEESTQKPDEKPHLVVVGAVPNWQMYPRPQHQGGFKTRSCHRLLGISLHLLPALCV